MGRLQPRDAPAFLIDEHRRIGAADGRPEVGDKLSHLLGAFAIALKQDEAQGIAVAEEVAFCGCERGAAATEDDGEIFRV